MRITSVSYAASGALLQSALASDNRSLMALAAGIFIASALADEIASR